MPTSTTIDGISRELTAWPATIDGVTREHAQLYAAIDGVQREIFAKLHKWNRYKIEYRVQEIVESGEFESYGVSKTSASIFYYASAIKATDATTVSMVYPHNEGVSYDTSSSNVTRMFENKWFGLLPSATELYYGTGERRREVRNGSYYIFLGYSKIARSSAMQGQFIDTVSSDDPNVYPENGISGDCWYVKID